MVQGEEDQVVSRVQFPVSSMMQDEKGEEGLQGQRQKFSYGTVSQLDRVVKASCYHVSPILNLPRTGSPALVSKLAACASPRAEATTWPSTPAHMCFADTWFPAHACSSSNV